MKRITLAMMLIAVTATVGAQTPPAAPVRPTEPTPRPAMPAPAARPVSPAEIDEWRYRLNDLPRLDRLDLEAPRAAMEAVRARQLEIGESVERARYAVDAVRDFAPIAPFPAFAPMEPLPAIAPFGGRLSQDFAVPRPQWVQGDPADSAYRFAQDVLNRGDYGRAAQLFRDIAAKYPKSAYQNDLPYYEAYARYKIGTTDELHSAVKLLEPRAAKLIGTTAPSSNGTNATTVYATTGRPEYAYGFGKRGASDTEFVNLYIRVNSVLAQRGDRGAADIVAKAAAAGANACDREDMDMKAEALGALSQMDPAGALPQVKKVLEKKDECSVSLRRRAVFMLGRRGDGEAATLLGTTAKSDPSVSVRGDAISWLPKLQGDAGVAALEDLLRTEQDENIQRSVVRTLVGSDNPKARTSMRALIERKDAPINLRLEAISSYNNDRATTEDAAYLRGLYARADNDRIKEAIIDALGRIGGPENDAFVLGIVKNTNEPSTVRSRAIGRLMRGNISIVDLGKLYDASESFNIRQQIVSQLDRRTETEAADKLYDIAKNSTDQRVRMQAFQALLRRKDDRTKQLLNDIIDGKKPS